ncbi:hypothetical protein R4315_21270 [Rhodococcus oxybenzonivorans]|uniref:Uncharacterized protein n=1 Tax=Rhodococcus oxybenzonivorans TaxID=1990687 RepID=A0AAE4V3C9_9NOCA|nr:MULTISPECIES: hypothetical protein [Rhodococcus]MDV7241774.1 hypothetical protein [Rhodococcus oxybenzonivorans]MDV7267063.1 hypothetical protein [Rhodococcus oxybenzonivorans]MDV7273692.1 hypothetical protein [Rhodococcus oxybenzonivorans]MDV7334056.1 hypothetical protein [Rhodococcus oxybenzonivorans]MDV7343475.1 hypothetical protein [Rhodococcus oxybenzonivorans]
MARVHTGESVLSRAVRIVESFHSDDSLLTVSEMARRRADRGAAVGGGIRGIAGRMPLHASTSGLVLLAH